MLLVFVEHFLEKEGKVFFRKWIAKVEEALVDFDGFIDICVLDDVEHKERSVLLLRFENLSKLRKWSSSATHDQLLAELKPHMQKKQKSQLFEMDA